MLRTIDAVGATITMTYDNLNRMVTRQQPGDGVHTTVYDAAGNVVNEVNGLGHRQTLVYDALGRKTKHVDALGGVTTFLYDLLNNRTGLIDPVGNRTTFVFDALNRVTDETDPLNKTATVAYDAVGRVSSQTDRLGRRREYSYDDSGRLQSETWKESGGATANVLTHTYDDNGNLLSAQDNDGTYTMVYDALNRVSGVQGLFGMRLTFTYDASGNRTKVEDSLGGVTTSVYNAVNALTQRQFGGSGQTPLRFDLAYTDRHQISGLSRYSDLSGSTLVGTTSYTYDGAGRHQNIHHKNGSGTSLINLTYTYDAASRVTSETRNGTGVSYAYDHTDQLTSDGANSYTYDANGNRTMSGYQTGAGNRMTNDGVYTYTYDDQGNTTKKSKGASLETWDYTYDHRNQLVGIEKRASDGGILELKLAYSYDVFGKRVAEDRWTATTGTVTTRFAYDGDDVWADLNGSNALQMRYIRLDGIDALAARINGSGTAGWYLVNHQGTVLANLNASGAVTNENVFDSFGGLVSQTSAGASDRYLYTGREYQSDSGYHYNRARWNKNGRWMTIDPIGFQAGDPNLYRYVGNSPTNHTDPSGRFPEDPSISGPLERKTAAEVGHWPWVSSPLQDGNTKVEFSRTGYLARVKEETLKKADERNMGDQARAAFRQGKPTAGVEIGDLLKKVGQQLNSDWAQMSDEKKKAIRESLYSANKGALAWDIKEMFKTENTDYFATTTTKGTIFRQFVTVKGEVHFAGAVNYYLWGRLNRLMFQDEARSPAVFEYVTKKAEYDRVLKSVGPEKEKIDSHGRPYVVTSEGFLKKPLNPSQYSLEKAIHYMIFFREVGGRTGRTQYSKGLAERAAWIQAGWFDDFKYASPVKLNDILEPSNETIKKSLTIRAGMEDEKFIYEKSVTP